MKRSILFLFLCWCSFVYGQRGAETVVLNEGWVFSKAGEELWREATVPGTVHQDLLRHGLLPDPFYGLNEQKIQWVEREDWEYKTCFYVTEEQLAREGALLFFEGLDTYADVFLNGSPVLRSDNMFVGHAVPVKDVLRAGENRLSVYFHSPIKQTLPQWASNGFDYPADNDHFEQHLSVFTRKAPYSYGWDWGIRMVTCGIWRPVTLQFYDCARVDDFHTRQLSLTDSLAVLSNRLEVRALSERDAEIRVTCALSGREVSRASRNVRLSAGLNVLELPLEIQSPQRWMPNGWGKPVLYDCVVEVVCGGDTVAEQRQRIGLRTFRVVNKEDADGESFYFEVNGIPMFAKGANFIPGDALLPRMDEERYRALFRDVKEANMNVVRVWGGGVYEDDCFYDLADENGVLIWQDFMFACTAYPGDAAFLERVKEEADYNIRRLRNHACLALWCGNNEIAEGLKYWGWQSRYSKEVYEKLVQDYDKLFCRLLPERVAALDSGRFYVHTSPYFANWGRPASWGVGDSHNWGIWYGRKPFESSDHERGRFISEFGFQSFPEMKTIASFAAPEDYDIESDVMNGHQKSSIGNSLIRTYMERDFIVPERFEDFVYVGLVLQGQGIRHCIEAHRRQRPYCMGSLYWQLNDSWPVVSWSGIDYYGNWKALHYQAKRAFSPLIINPIQEDGKLNVWLISDRLDSLVDLTLTIQVMDFEGKKLGKRSLRLGAPANDAVQVFSGDLDEWGERERRRERFLVLTLKDRRGREVARNVHFFVKTKELKLPETSVDCEVKVVENGRCEVVLSSPRLAKDVFVQVPEQGVRFSDNFFDLLPGERRRIVLTSPMFRKGEKPVVTVKHIRETYQ